MNACNMEDVAFWGTCDSQPLQPVGLFNGPESQASLLPCHVEPPFSQYPWQHDQWRTDDISDIALITVDPLAYDHVLGHHAVAAETMHDLPVGTPKFSQQGQWGHSDFYPAHDVHEILNASYMSINSPTLSSPHLPQDLTSFKSFGTITPVHQSRPINVPYGGTSLPSSNRPVSSSNASPYVVSPVSMGMFPPANVPQRIISTSGMDGPCISNTGMLQHVPKLHHPMRIAAKANVNVTVVDVPGVPAFGTNLKSSTLSPLGESSSHRRNSVAEEPKMASFNPGPYVNSARPLVPTQKQQEDAHRMWLDNNTRGKSCAVPILNSRHGQQQQQQQHQQAMCNSSPVMNLGPEQRPMSNSSPAMSLGYDQRAMSNSSPVTSMAFESRHPNSLNNSSPATRMVFEQRSKQPIMTSSSPIPTVVGFELSPQQQPMTSSPSVPIMGLQQHQAPMTSSSPNPGNDFEARQQPPPMSNSSPTPNLCNFEHNQQPTMSASPPLSNLNYEPRQPPPAPPPPISSSPSTSNLVFEPMRQQPNPSTLPNLARQQAAANVLRPDSGEPASKWSSFRMAGGVPVSEKVPIMRQQPEAGTIKCALPRSTSAMSSPATNVPSVNKRPLWADDNKNNQSGSMNKKPMQRWQGAGACSRLEEISAAAHQKVTQNTSGRALGPALNTNLKPRARQGSANDPQSIAARVRRERISERLKVLQTLIPNGDKVDMVTMLEKAINYVQCLEVQIRMLKNDSLWPKALGPLPNTLQELLELAGPEFLGDKDMEELLQSERATTTKKTAPEVIEFDGNQPSTDKE